MLCIQCTRFILAVCHVCGVRYTGDIRRHYGASTCVKDRVLRMQKVAHGFRDTAPGNIDRKRFKQCPICMAVMTRLDKHLDSVRYLDLFLGDTLLGFFLQFTRAVDCVWLDQ